MALNSLFYKEIRAHHLFNCLSDECFHVISQHSGLISLKKNEILFECGYEASHFFLVRTGQVTLFQTSLDGNEKIVDIFGAGQTFAETSMFAENKCYPVNARATCDTDLFYFDSDIFKTQLHQSSDSCFSMMSEMSNRLKNQTQEIIELSIHDAQYRLVNYLLEHRCDNNDLSCFSMVKLPTTKSLLASRLSITPETFSRILSRLKKQGLITIEDDVIILIDPVRLREVIGCCNGHLQKRSKVKQILRSIA